MTPTQLKIAQVEEEYRQLVASRPERVQRQAQLRGEIRALEQHAVATAVLDEDVDSDRLASLQAELEELTTAEERNREELTRLQAAKAQEDVAAVQALMPKVEKAIARRHAALEKIAFAAVKAYVAGLEALREQPEEAELHQLLTASALSPDQRREVERRLREMRNRGPAEWVGAELSDQIQRACGVGSPALAFLQGLGVPTDSEPFRHTGR